MTWTFPRFPELWFTLAIVTLVVSLSVLLGLPVSFPSGDRAAFVGIHYLYPLVGVGIFGLFAFLGRRTDLSATFLIALPCYAIVLICHFNLKLWIPHVNPVLWDPFYWQIDQALRPVVVACMTMRQAIAPIVPLDSNLYMTAFIAMFYISFCFHALRTPEKFRSLFLAALLFQGLGAIAYFIMPAIGPFLYEPGVEPMATRAQAGMMEAYRANIAGGSGWLEQNGSTHWTAGLAAMPSLHTGGSFLFLLYAWRHARQLFPLYVLLFVFIAIAAVANRWHYIIDVPIGVLLAACSVRIAEWLSRDQPGTEETVATPHVDEPALMTGPASS